MLILSFEIAEKVEEWKGKASQKVEDWKQSAEQASKEACNISVI